MTRSTAFRTGLALALLTLSGCAPDHVNSASAANACERVRQAAAIAHGIAQVLIANGVEPERAAKVDQGVALGAVTIDAACAVIVKP